MRYHVINALANHPEILPYVAPGYESVDLSAFLAQPQRNKMFGSEGGVVLFAYAAPGRYEVHYLFTPSCRGKGAFHVVKGAIHDMFTYHDASVIYGSTPRDNRAARAMNRALGAKPTGVSTDSLGRACIDYELERDAWVRLSAASLAASEA